MQLGTVASQQAERICPARPRQQIDQRQQTQADRQVRSCCAVRPCRPPHRPSSTRRDRPARGRRRSRRDARKRKKRSTPQRCARAASRAAYQARSRSRRCTGRQLLRRHADKIGQRPIGAGADVHGRGMFGRFHRWEGWTRKAACASLCARLPRRISAMQDPAKLTATEAARLIRDGSCESGRSDGGVPRADRRRGSWRCGRSPGSTRMPRGVQHRRRGRVRCMDCRSA